MSSEGEVQEASDSAGSIRYAVGPDASPNAPDLSRINELISERYRTDHLRLPNAFPGTWDDLPMEPPEAAPEPQEYPEMPLPQSLLSTTTTPTIRDMKAANWRKLREHLQTTVPKEKYPEELSRIKEAIQYIENLSSQVGVDPSLWSLRNLGWPDFTSKNEVNSLFFKEWEKWKAQILPRDLSDHIAKQVDNLTKNHFESLRDEIEESRLSLRNSVEKSLKSVEQALEKTQKLTIQLNRLMDRSIGFVPMINEIQSKGYFKYQTMTPEKRLIFETTQDCILTYDNDSTDQHFRVNFGKFLVEYRLLTGTLLVLPFEKNPNFDGYYHPHINTSGKVCWGSGAGTAAKHLVNMDLPKLFNLLHGVLTTYNDEAPFIGLSDFQTIQLSSAPPNYKGKGSTPAICPSCEQYLDVCNCLHCESCDRRYRDGENCNGAFCDYCDRCTGGDPCREHFCRICQTYREPGECDCCTDCRHSECECERCPDCDERRGFVCNATVCGDCANHEEDCECEEEEPAQVEEPPNW